MTNRELMLLLGYRISAHTMHGARQGWAWEGPLSDGGTHYHSRREAWEAAEKNFKRVLLVFEKLAELLKGRV